MEVDDPARLAEPARVRVVGVHLRLGDVQPELAEDPGEEARAAPADPDHEEQLPVAHASTLSSVRRHRSAPERRPPRPRKTRRTTRSAARPSSSAQKRARKAARRRAGPVAPRRSRAEAPRRAPPCSRHHPGRLGEEVEVRAAKRPVDLPVGRVDDDRAVEHGVVEHERRVVGAAGRPPRGTALDGGMGRDVEHAGGSRPGCGGALALVEVVQPQEHRVVGPELSASRRMSTVGS